MMSRERVPKHITGSSYYKGSFFLRDSTLVIAPLMIIVGVLWFIWGSPATVGWAGIGVGVLLLVGRLFWSRPEHRWLKHHDAGVSAYRSRNLDRAEQEFMVSVTYAEAFSMKDNRLAQSLNNLGAILLEEKRYDEALPILERSLAIYKRSVGPGPDRSAEVQRNLQVIKSRRS